MRISIAVVSFIGMMGLAFAQGTQQPESPPQTARAGEQPKPGARTEPKPGPVVHQQMQKPPAEIAEMMKTIGPRLRCTGMAMGGPEMNTEMKLTGTITNKVDLDGWFIRSVLNASMGEGKQAMKLKMESLQTYDPNAKTWRAVTAMNDGGVMLSTAEPMQDGKLQSMAQTWGPTGSGRMREQVDTSDPKTGIKMMGEMSNDEGKTWNKVYEMTCKR